MKDHHLMRWGWHPAVTTDDRTFGERSADKMKNALATWAALLTMGVFIGGWMFLNSFLAGKGHHFDPYPWILLNLMLSTLAGLQCFVLLIANKRGEEIAAQTAKHTYENTELIKTLLAQNTELTTKVAELTTAVHQHIVGESAA